MSVFVKFRNRHFLILDLLFLLVIPVIALSLRVNLPWGREYLPSLAVFIGLALAIKLPVFLYFRLYSRYWPFASIDALVTISLAVTVTTTLIAGLYFTISGLGYLVGDSLPRSLPFIDGLLTLVVVGGTRFSVRTAQYYRGRNQPDAASKRVLIVGAGDAGQIVAREILTSRRISLNLIGFVDDSPDKISSTIHGARVLGPLARIPDLVDEYKIQQVIIAMPTAPGQIIRQVVSLCETARVPAKILPGVYELLAGDVNVNRLREVEIGDLLRRDSVQVDSAQVARLLSGKRILVTGAGGSIGSELCRQIVACNPAHLVVIGHGENSLYKLESRLVTGGFDPRKLQVVVADVRQKRRLARVFSTFRPEIVFHAAAHKHVPMMEDNVADAVTNNVLGTANLVGLAKDYGVERFVLVSTDKAVNPVNVMGMTKRVAELIVQMAATETERPYASVRFGNVLGSRGSVVPLFERQIHAGGPVTVTDPEMTRYFMTIPEAVQLVLQASALGTNGELFVLDMGDPIKIADLARDMIELSGLKVGDDIEIVYTGLRPGERLYENLFADSEHPERTEHEKIFVHHNGLPALSKNFSDQLENLIQLALAGQTTPTLTLLRQLALGE